MSKFDLSGRSALVTGGARGLGAGMAAALTEAGARVMIADVLKDVGEQTAAGLPGGGFVELDVTGDAAWEAAIAHTVAELGGFDVLVNNAGIEVTALVTEIDADELRADARGQRAGHRCSASSTACARCAPAARRAAAGPSSMWRRWPRPSRSRASPATRPPSPRSTG